MENRRKQDTTVFKVGVALKALIFFSIISILFYGGFYFGMQAQQIKQQRTDVEVLHNDSIETFEISTETKKAHAELKQDLKNVETIVDDNGYMSDDFMQLLRAAKSDAERRGDKTNIIHNFTRSR